MVSILLLALCSVSSLELPIESTLRSTPRSKSLDSTSLSRNGMINYFNYEYTVKLSLGSPPQEINFGLDLLNNYILVPLDTCNCHASNSWFSPSQSTTFKNTSDNFIYPNSWWEIKGHWGKESFYVKKDEIKKTDFVAVDFDKGLQGYAADGFLGLGFGLAGDRHNGLIPYMKSKGIIKKAIFSVYLNNILNPYKMPALTIGTWKPEDYSDGPAAVIKIDKSSPTWETKIGSMWVDQTRIFSGSANVFFDMLANALNVEPKVYSKFIAELQKAEPSCKTNGFGSVQCKCNHGDYTNFPDLSFGIGGQQFLVHAENYLAETGGGMCEVLVYDSYEYKFWVMGLPFFREFYSMFDIEKREIHVARAMRNGRFYNVFKVYQSGIAAASILAVGAIFVAYKRRREDGYQLIN